MTIKEIYKKKYQINTYSGTLALESVLRILTEEIKVKILINSVTCYSVLQAILNSNVECVIATPNNGLVFTNDELEELVNKENINTLLIVHPYGYIQDYKLIDGVTIIEDVSQAWNIKEEYKSDYIIESLGKTKPLSNGIGGVILTNNDIRDYFDYKTKEDRYKNKTLIEYVYPLEIDEDKIIRKANINYRKRIKEATKLTNIFKKYNFIDISLNNITSSYHRYIIDTNNKEELLKIFDKVNLDYQLEFKKDLGEIPISNNKKIKVIKTNNKKQFILIKTTNTIETINNLQKEMKNYYENKS